MGDDPKKVTLAELANGAAEALFQEAFGKVLENIRNPNTPWKKKREITLVIAINSDEERRHGWVSIGCEIKVPSDKAIETIIHIAKDQGQVVGVEVENQEDMFKQPEGRPSGVIEGGSAKS